MTRKFDIRPAAREKTPLLVGLIGPSGSGKTYSALRLAAGFQRISGGDTYVIDTEARRSLHYAEKFKFQHLAFGAPFGPLDYLDAINTCVNAGATTIIVDSFSHEHEGPGGVLEMHQAEHERIGGREGTKMLAWGKPKRERRRLINSILQMNCNFVFCFRAKEKLKMERGKDPEKLGFMPIAGEEFIYELTLKCLLLPGANGIPTWHSDFFGEKAMIKLPEQFRSTFSADPQLTEDVGEQLAKWAAGGSSVVMTADELVSRYEACSDAATHGRLEDARRAVWSHIKKDQPRVKAASDAAAARIQEQTTTAA